MPPNCHTSPLNLDTIPASATVLTPAIILYSIVAHRHGCLTIAHGEPRVSRKIGRVLKWSRESKKAGRRPRGNLGTDYSAGSRIQDNCLPGYCMRSKRGTHLIKSGSFARGLNHRTLIVAHSLLNRTDQRRGMYWSLAYPRTSA